jgi:hypothetical protein
MGALAFCDGQPPVSDLHVGEPQPEYLAVGRADRRAAIQDARPARPFTSSRKTPTGAPRPLFVRGLPDPGSLNASEPASTGARRDPPVPAPRRLLHSPKHARHPGRPACYPHNLTVD